MPIRPVLGAVLALIAMTCANLAFAQTTTTHTWTGAMSGEWGDPANWSTYLVPNSGDDAVVFNSSATEPFTATIGLNGSPFTANSIIALNGNLDSTVILGTTTDPSSQSLALYNNSGATPTVRVSSGLLQIAAAVNATQGITKSGNGTLSLTGPISGKSVTLNGGKLDIAGANTCSTVTYDVMPMSAALSANTTVESGMRLLGTAALSSNASLSFNFGNQTLANNTIIATLDLGGVNRSVSQLTFGDLSFYSGSNGDSSIIIDIQNGGLEAKRYSSFDLSWGGSGMNTEVRLPDSSVMASSSLDIGSGSDYTATGPKKLNTGKLRIGTTAVFRLRYAIYMGYNGSSGRIEARAPNSTLTISGSNATTRLSSINLGNRATTRAGYDTAIDMENGTLNLLAASVRISGASSATNPTKASIRFGNGTVDVTSLTIGDSPQDAYDCQCSIVQKGGAAKIASLAFTPTYSGTASGTRTFRYKISGGTLEVGNATGQGNFILTGTLSRGFDWSGGIIRNYSGNSSSINTTGNGTITSPIDIAVSGNGTRTLDVETGRSFVLGIGTRLSSDSNNVILQKTGDGTLQFEGDTTPFNGQLRLDAGRLVLGQTAARTTAHAGEFFWNTGNLSYDLSSTDNQSDRWLIDRALVTGPAPAANRQLDLKSSGGAFTYTLATYASTDLTLSSFTVTGIRTGYTADLVVGSSALTVTLSPAAGLAAWRIAKFQSASNTGSATDLADPDADERPNLMEYATGTEPLAADANQVTAIAATPANRLALTFTRIEDVYLRYTVQASASAAGPWDEVVFTSTGASNLAGPITVEDNVSLADFPTRFLRLQVTRLSAPGIP